MTQFSELRMSKVSTSVAPRRRRAGPLVAAAAALLLAACSTAPDWTRPSTISDAITGKAPSEPTNEAVAARQAEAEAASERESFPSAGSVPGVPETGNYADKQDLANSLAADRQHARYSGEALRGGTEPPASPLPSRRAEPLPDLPALPAETAEASAGAVIPERGIPAYRAPDRRMGDADEGEDMAMPAPEAAPAIEVATLPAPEAPVTSAPSAPAVAAAPEAAAAPVAAVQTPAATPTPRVASADPARRPAVPARSVPTYVAEADATRELESSAPQSAGRMVVPSSPVPSAPVAAASGEPQFAVSSAPPLPAEVMDQVPAVVSARFEETRGADATPLASPASAQTPATSSDGVVIDYSAIGSGSPVPNTIDMEQGSSSVLPMSDYEPFGTSSGAEGGPFTPVALYFDHGSASLSADDKAEIADIAALQTSRGGGIVRVVGHASSRTSNLPVESHLLANFEMSMARANVVATELMRHGVAASDMVIEAVGDRAPVFYESMPAGEAGNRRAEIFLE